MTAEATPQRRRFLERLPWVRQGIEDSEARNLAVQLEARIRRVSGIAGFTIIYEGDKSSTQTTTVFLRNRERLYKASIDEVREKDYRRSCLEVEDVNSTPQRCIRLDKIDRVDNVISRRRSFHDHVQNGMQQSLRYGSEFMREIISAEPDEMATAIALQEEKEELEKPQELPIIGLSKEIGVPADDFAFIPIVST